MLRAGAEFGYHWAFMRDKIARQCSGQTLEETSTARAVKNSLDQIDGVEQTN